MASIGFGVILPLTLYRMPYAFTVGYGLSVAAMGAALLLHFQPPPTSLAVPLGPMPPWAAGGLQHDPAAALLLPPPALGASAGLGGAMGELREPRLGWPAAVAMHGGLDFAAAYWCLDLRYGWTTPLYARACGLALEAAVHRSWLAPLDVCASALAEL